MEVARFEKVSETQFHKDMFDQQGIEGDYACVQLPVRATYGSAGYDFYCPIDIDIQPGQLVKIPSGIRCYIENGYVLNIYPRSSLGFKYQLTLANTTGIIDSDYYNADNEGHIIVALVNRGNKTVEIKKGDRIVQGIFLAFYTAEEDNTMKERHGGFGSTN